MTKEEISPGAASKRTAEPPSNTDPKVSVVLWDFWAEWCAPCRAITPILEQLASDFEGKVKVVKINVDENPDLAQNYGVQAIPTLLIFKNGQTVDRIVGAAQKSHYADKLKQVIGN